MVKGCFGESEEQRRFCLKKNRHCGIKRTMVLKSIILGIIQGLTEFLPVSSSGHLVIVKNLMGFKSPGVFFEVLLHFATLLAIIVVFAKRIGKIIKSLFSARIRMKNGHWIVTDKNLRFFFYLLWASIPSALVGIFLKSNIEKLFSQPLFVSIMLLITGCVLFSLRFVRSEKLHEHNALSSTMIGIAQVFSILPGISRS
ncbi:MAG: undecaprenyl-diphosphate phosphatase, partial [Candidatus Cloacimonadota bacterium]